MNVTLEAFGRTLTITFGRTAEPLDDYTEPEGDAHLDRSSFSTTAALVEQTYAVDDREVSLGFTPHRLAAPLRNNGGPRT